MPGLKRIEHRYILFPLFFLFSPWVNVVTGDYPKKKKGGRKLFIWENEFLGARIRFLLLHTRAGI